MAPRDRRRSNRLHFSGSGNRFDNKKRSVAEIDHNPISKTFTRKIVYCKRCNNRVVSNVNHCPFCGKSLLPLYRRIWFWLVVVLLITAGAVAVIVFMPGLRPAVDTHDTPVAPVVVGAPEGASIKDLALGTTVDCDSLLVTVTESLSEHTSATGGAVTTVRVQFINKGTESTVLVRTQWQLEGADGTRVDSEPIKLQDGTNITSDLDSMTLTPGSTYTATLYFALTDPARVVFAPDALSYAEANLVTWTIPAAANTGGDAAGGTDQVTS